MEELPMVEASEACFWFMGQDLRIKVYGVGFWVSDVEFRISDFGFRVQGLGFGVKSA